ncbi:hypothetical protein PFISCL1PPCAC_9521 [Pristionchus fissidentatus]|uniref:NEDD8-activating enzyme E1 regulatory subunit n=1 Tax=Pristionchus fissidentatus TaxID=1538716 RepID=A0AAV5VIF2_9BILA|nr:hypothetical protein PFISCL1PPCAC_9521 [Pristionchus fissidentatus]
MKDRYDRQVRLWGDDGQSAIGNTTVCVLGASALGTEILKSLVLAGIDSFCIVDDAIVSEPDLGTNFFLDAADLGKPRAEAALLLLKELNPSVRGTCLLRSPVSTEERHLEELRPFSVVVATNMAECKAAPISAFLYDRGIPMIYSRVYGFLGTIRIAVAEQPIVNTHRENQAPDLRLDAPFPALQSLIDAIDFDKMTDEQVRHTPYLILYALALKEYRKTDPTAFPSTLKERKEFLHYVMKLARERESGGTDENFDQAKSAMARSLRKTQMPSSVRAILADAKCGEGEEATAARGTDPFWIMCTALRRFVDRHGVLPLSGQLPDMASDSASYARLATVYHEKALADAEEVLAHARELQKRARGAGADADADVERDENDDGTGSGDKSKSSPLLPSRASASPSSSITHETCMRMCKNAAAMDLQRGTAVDSWSGAGFRPVLASIAATAQYDEETEKPLAVSSNAGSAHPAVWLLMLRAVDRFNEEKSRSEIDEYPGTNGIPCEMDSRDLWERVKKIVDEGLRREEKNEEESMEEDDLTAETVLAQVPYSACSEMCRYAASEPHAIASLLGGMAAQEVIKLATRQYIPVENTLVYDAHSGLTETFKL